MEVDDEDQKPLSTISLMDMSRVQARRDAVLRTPWPCGDFPGSASFISSHITQEMVEAFNLLFDTVLSKREPLFFFTGYPHPCWQGFHWADLWIWTQSIIIFFFTTYRGLLPDLLFLKIKPGRRANIFLWGQPPRKYLPRPKLPSLKPCFHSVRRSRIWSSWEGCIA